MTFETAVKTDTGRVRDVNEDSVYVGTGEGWRLLAVADGMGGHAAGDVASEEALEAFWPFVEQRLADGGRDVEGVLTSGVTTANDRLRKMIAEDSSLEGMGTTLVAAAVESDVATLVNIGDSRAYHVTADSIEQVTVDQSLVQQLVEQGEITPEEADSHPQRNVVSQVLGTEDSVEPDTYDLTVSGTLLLCSDGLPEEVSASTIHDIVMGASDLETAADELIETANANGGSDNLTVALLQYKE
jgi:serine/threonine protein phosphatase PrpC